MEFDSTNHCAPRKSYMRIVECSFYEKLKRSVWQRMIIHLDILSKNTSHTKKLRTLNVVLTVKITKRQRCFHKVFAYKSYSDVNILKFCQQPFSYEIDDINIRVAHIHYLPLGFHCKYWIRSVPRDCDSFETINLSILHWTLKYQLVVLM